MVQDSAATLEDLLQILEHALPDSDTLTVIDTNHDDNSIIFNWRNNGYVLSSYPSPSSRSGQKVAVGRVCPHRYSDDNSPVLLEMLVNRHFSDTSNALQAG